MAEVDWDSFKPEIERLYMRENKPLSEVMRFLDGVGFSKTKNQYERKFKEWGWQKYRMTPSKWKKVGKKIEKRKRQGHESDVYIDGVLCPQAKVRKEVSRHGFISASERFNQAPSPATPEGIAVRSPAPPGAYTEWDQNSPWFQFWRVVKPQLDSVNLTSPLRPDSSRARLTTQKNLNRLGNIVEYYVFSATIRSITAHLQRFMPEDRPTQHLETASSIASGSGVAFRHSLAVYLFRLSNNLADLGDEDTFNEFMDTDSSRIMQLFEQGGPNALRSLKTLPDLVAATAVAVAEKVLEGAIQRGDLKIARTLLKAGLDINLPVCDNEFAYSNTPLAVAMRDLCRGGERIALDMTRLLLSYGAAVNEGDPLSYAVEKDYRQIAQILLDHGAVATPSALKSAVARGDIIMAKKFIEAGVDVNAERASDFTTKTTLGTAVKLGDSQIIQMLLDCGANVDAPVSFSEPEELLGVYVSTALGIAAARGDVRIVELLLNAKTDCNIQHGEDLRFPFAPPLWLAVKHNHQEVVRLLLRAGASLRTADWIHETTLLELVASNRDMKSDGLQLGGILLAAGANVNRPVRHGQENSTSALILAISRGRIEFVRLLIAHGARVNEALERIPSTALAQSIQEGSCELVRLLWSAGARNLGNGISCIRHVETAFYLKEIGVLNGLLQTMGPDILGTAIKSSHTEMIQLLLLLNIDLVKENCLKTMMSPLGAAAFAGNQELIDLLLANGAYVTENVVTSAVHNALTNGNNEIVRRLIFASRPRVVTAPTAFCMAIVEKNIELIHVLLKAGIEPTGEGVFSWCGCCPRLTVKQGVRHPAWWLQPRLRSESLLKVAATAGDRTILRVFLQAREWAAGGIGSALVMAIENYDDHCVKDLLGAGADINHLYPFRFDVVRDWNFTDASASPLVAAVARRNKAWARILIDAGADVNYQPEDEWSTPTPLQAASWTGDIEMVDRLLNMKANVNSLSAEPYHATALQLAAIRGHLLIAKKLIGAGANINGLRALEYGRTALEGAAEEGRIEMLHLLITEGAWITDGGRKQYIRAVKMAERNAHGAAAMLLKSYGGWTDLDSTRYDEEDIKSEEAKDEFTVEG